jgi:4-diphosphocytidyl-2-C-methyl-D-erythritol kinase
MSGKGLTLPSFAKINPVLRVLGKRADGFHEIYTILQTISLTDELTFSPDSELSLVCDDPAIPPGRDNIIMRTAERLRERYEGTSGAKIILKKRIPSPGGLGGGSSNAAITLLALNKLWGIGAKVEELAEIGAEIGSDVPFFFYGGTCIGTGTGRSIEPAIETGKKYVIIVTPDLRVSTAEAYKGLNASNLTTENAERILFNYRFSAETDGLDTAVFENDFEPTVFGMYPEIKAVKDELLGLGAKAAMLSGSGASVFGVFDNLETRQTALEALGHKPDWRSFAVATVSRNEYREALNEVF